MAHLLSSTKLMRLHEADREAGFVDFDDSEDDDDETEAGLAMTFEFWGELGSPTELTVRIMPGDQLND